MVVGSGSLEISEQSCAVTGWRKGRAHDCYVTTRLGGREKKKRRVALIVGSACAVTGFLVLQLLGGRLALFCIRVD